MIKDVINYFYRVFLIKSNLLQCNEEIILDKAYKGHKSGFYVYVHCHYPKRFTKIAVLYKKKWDAINVVASHKNLKFFNIFFKKANL